MICLNMLLSQKTRKQLLMTKGMTDNLDATNILEKSLEGIYNRNQTKKFGGIDL